MAMASKAVAVTLPGELESDGDAQQWLHLYPDSYAREESSTEKIHLLVALIDRRGA